MLSVTSATHVRLFTDACRVRAPLVGPVFRSRRSVVTTMASVPQREVVSTDRAPGAVGPYSQAIKAAGPMVFVSGQVGLIPGVRRIMEARKKGRWDVYKFGGIVRT